MCDPIPRTKEDLLREAIEPIDATRLDTGALVGAMFGAAGTARAAGRAAMIVDAMARDAAGRVALALSGPVHAAGLDRAAAALVECGLVGAVVAGAEVVEQDLYAALGNRFYRVDDGFDADEARTLRVGRLGDALIDRDRLDVAIAGAAEVVAALPAGAHPSRALLDALGVWLAAAAPGHASLLATCRAHGVPCHAPDVALGRGGLGAALAARGARATIDAATDLAELVQRLGRDGEPAGMIAVGGAAPQALVQRAAGARGRMLKYAVALAPCARGFDAALTWDEIDVVFEQAVDADPGLVLPLIAAHAWQRRGGQVAR